MHRSAAAFLADRAIKHGWAHRKDFKVLDVGSLDVNGNNRHLFHKEASYTGIDPVPGRNVDQVCTILQFNAPHTFDVVISSEMLEHSPTWRDDLVAMAEYVKSNGHLVITCAGRGRPEHGTRKHPQPGMVAQDYYRNLEVREIMEALHDFDWQHFMILYNPDAHDVYLDAWMGDIPF